jgi:uncharacterized protein (DUF2147 family)
MFHYRSVFMGADRFESSANRGEIKKFARRALAASNRAVLSLATLLALVIPGNMVWAGPAVPQGLWVVDGRAAVQIYDCNGLMCGRLRWMDPPRDAKGEPKRDKNNPDPALRQRELCGLTLIWDLHPTAPGRWEGGRFYDPDSGRTYKVMTELTASDQLVARFYEGITLVGETKTLSRTRPGPSSEGWC